MVFVKAKLNTMVVTPTSFLCYLLWMFPPGILYGTSPPRKGRCCEGRVAWVRIVHGERKLCLLISPRYTSPASRDPCSSKGEVGHEVTRAPACCPKGKYGKCWPTVGVSRLYQSSNSYEPRQKNFYNKLRKCNFCGQKTSTNPNRRPTGRSKLTPSYVFW